MYFNEQTLIIENDITWNFVILCFESKSCNMYTEINMNV